jgi:hypothetical protein
MSDAPRIGPLAGLGFGFIEAPYLPPGEDENYLRFQQAARPAVDYRRLTPGEIEELVAGGNTSDDWSNVLVAEGFRAELVRACDFRGLVRIGRLDAVCLESGDLRLPVGLYHSRIIAGDLGDNVAVHNVGYLAHVIVGDQSLLFNVNEMLTTRSAKFGNGIVKDGEDESSRLLMNLCNENGARGVPPLDGMIAADAFFWAKCRDDKPLLERFAVLTQKSFDSRRGYYGTVGRQAVIKNCRTLKDVRIGDHACISGANRLENLTVNSSAAEPTEIGEGCELVDGIVGFGNHVSFGVKAVRFATGRNVKLEYGARVIHSYLGDNSTVACCELRNNLIFGGHEQHHNNSFLCASLLRGQSNIAAGATIGSNHNSRAPDGEIVAGRGFWAGLCTSFKHNSRFASFVLAAKGSYPAELDVPLPFSLVSNDEAHDRLLVMPAYWFMYNMYALARNSWKFSARDRRVRKLQHIEFDALAPDTVEEMFTALALLERWIGRAWCRKQGQTESSDAEAAKKGRELLMAGAAAAAEIDGLEVLGEAMENSSRQVVILKARQAWHEYRAMIHYYAVKTSLAWHETHAGEPLEMLLAGKRVKVWTNLGGQLVMAADLAELKRRIPKLETWDEVHAEYDRLWEKYPLDKARHALASLVDLRGNYAAGLTAKHWGEMLDRAVEIQNEISARTFATRAKDFENPFRKITFDSAAEMTAVLGRAEENSFVSQVRAETPRFAERVAALKGKI